MTYEPAPEGRRQQAWGATPGTASGPARTDRRMGCCVLEYGRPGVETPASPAACAPPGLVFSSPQPGAAPQATRLRPSGAGLPLIGVCGRCPSRSLHAASSGACGRRTRSSSLKLTAVAPVAPVPARVRRTEGVRVGRRPAGEALAGPAGGRGRGCRKSRLTPSCRRSARKVGTQVWRTKGSRSEIPDGTNVEPGAGKRYGDTCRAGRDSRPRT
jgi:hypothetical protein